MSEYAQTSPKRVDYHVYPSGNKVIKTFIADDFDFYDKMGDTIELLDNSYLDKVHKVKITWRILKNCQNGQAITYQPKRFVTRYALFVLLREWYSKHNV